MQNNFEICVLCLNLESINNDKKVFMHAHFNLGRPKQLFKNVLIKNNFCLDKGKNRLTNRN